MRNKPSLSTAPVAKINDALPEDAEIIRKLTFNIPRKMEEHEFRFMLFENGIVDFDSLHDVSSFPHLTLEEYNNMNCRVSNYDMESSDYSVFSDPNLPTSTFHREYTERIRVHKVGNYVMASKMFSYPASGLPSREETPSQPITSLDQLRKVTTTTRVPNSYFHIGENWSEIDWSWQMEQPRDERDEMRLSLPYIRLKFFRNQQMLRTMELENSKPTHQRLPGDLRDHIFVIAFLVPNDHWKFLVDHLVYLDRELSRMKVELFEWIRNNCLTNKLVSDKWNSMRKTIMHVQSCSKIKDPTRLLGMAAFLAKREDFGRTVLDVLNRLNENKFVSKLLSAFLMHSLNWVLTVLSDSYSTRRRARRYFREHDFPFENCSIEHEQYLEVIGSSGPHDSVKIIVLGTNERDIMQLCEMMAYFFRKTSELPSEKEEEYSSDDSEWNMYEHDLANLEKDETQENRYDKLLRRIENSHHVEFPNAREKTQIVDDLFAANVDEFSNYFVVQGIRKTEENQKDLVEKIVHELRQEDGFAPFQERLNDDPIPRKIYIMADIDNQTIKIVSENTVADFDTPATSIDNALEDIKMCEGFTLVSEIFVDLDSAMEHLVSNSLTFMEILKRQSIDEFIETRRICSILECDITDMKMIFNICTSYFPVAYLTVRDNDFRRSD